MFRAQQGIWHHSQNSVSLSCYYSSPSGVSLLFTPQQIFIEHILCVPRCSEDSVMNKTNVGPRFRKLS